MRAAGPNATGAAACATAPGTLAEKASAVKLADLREDVVGRQALERHLLGNPAAPGEEEDVLPSAAPPAGQEGEFANPSDGALAPAQPGILDTSSEDTPNTLPIGQLPETLSRRQLEMQPGAEMQPSAVTVEELGEVDASDKGTLDEAAASSARSILLNEVVYSSSLLVLRALEMYITR